MPTLVQLHEIKTKTYIKNLRHTSLQIAFMYMYFKFHLLLWNCTNVGISYRI